MLGIVLVIVSIAGAGWWVHSLTSAEDNAADIPPIEENLPPPNLNSMQEIDAADESTWPRGNRVWDLCRAAASAEGYGKQGAVPTRAHNPGDLGLGDLGFGVISTDSVVTVFAKDIDGWNHLYNQFNHIITGTSPVYKAYAQKLGLVRSADLTFLQLAQKYAGDWQNWCANVTRYLKVEQTMTLWEFVNA